MDGLDVEGLEGPSELGQLSLVLGVIDTEDAVFVRVEGDRTAMLLQITLQGLHVGLGRLSRKEAQCHQLTGGIIDEDDQGAARSTSLEPVMGGAVDLDQLPPAGPAWTALVNTGLTPPLRLPWPIGDHPLAQGLDTDFVAMTLGQLLAGERGAEVGIIVPDNPEDRLPHGIRERVPRTFLPMA